MRIRVTPPRYAAKGLRLFVTVEAVNRSFRFVPTRDVRDSIAFLFALLVAEYGLLVHDFFFMSNHFHFVATDPRGEISAFLREFDSRLSRQLNALRGTTGTNFAREPTIIPIADGKRLLEHLVYVLTNAISAGLVQRLSQWKGVHSLGLEYGKTVTIPRPKCGLWAETRRSPRKGKHASSGRLRYRGRSKAPEVAELTLARPDILPELSDSELRAHVRDLAGQKERALIAERKRTGKSVLGWLNVLRQHYLAVPGTPRVLFERRPRVSGSDPVLRDALLQTIRSFERDHARAVADTKAGKNPVFPYGTLQMVRRYGFRCATAPP